MFDGLDGAGKDAHARRLAEWLVDGVNRVELTSHPTDRFFGKATRSFLRRYGRPARLLASLFFTLDVLVSVRLLKRKREGIMIFVRYLMGTAYLPRRLARMSYRLFRNLLPRPDIAIFLDTEPRIAMARIASRDRKREMFETEEKLAQVRELAMSLMTDEWIIIDNNEEGDGPFARAREIVGEHLNRKTSLDGEIVPRDD